MPKKKRLTEPEVHALITKEARYRLGCEDFAPDFTLHQTEVDRTRYPNANWDVLEMHNSDAWLPDARGIQGADARQTSSDRLERYQAMSNLRRVLGDGSLNASAQSGSQSVELLHCRAHPSWRSDKRSVDFCLVDVKAGAKSSNRADTSLP